MKPQEQPVTPPGQGGTPPGQGGDFPPNVPTDGSQGGNPGGGGGGPQPPEPPPPPEEETGFVPPVPYERFQEVANQRRLAEQQAAEVQARLDELSAEHKKMQAQMAEQIRLANLAEARAQRMAVINNLRLPAFLEPLIQGDDEDAMVASASSLQESLMAAFEQMALPQNAGITPRGGGNPTPTITPEQLNDPAWVRENQDLVRAYYGGKK